MPVMDGSGNLATQQINNNNTLQQNFSGFMNYSNNTNSGIYNQQNFLGQQQQMGQTGVINYVQQPQHPSYGIDNTIKTVEEQPKSVLSPFNGDTFKPEISYKVENMISVTKSL